MLNTELVNDSKDLGGVRIGNIKNPFSHSPKDLKENAGLIAGLIVSLIPSAQSPATKKESPL